MKRIIVFLLAFILNQLILFAQEITEPEELFSEGEFFFLAEEYQEALYYFLQLVELYPDHPNYNYKVGNTYLQIPGQRHKAIPYLEKAIKQTSLKYNRKDFNEENAPHHSYYYLGRAYRINNELDKALTIYQVFTESDEFEGNYNLTIVENEIKACERAKIIQDVPLNIRETKLSEPINTPKNNYNAVLSGDQNTMVFIAEQTFYDAIVLSKNINGNWTEPEILNPQVGSDGDLYPTCLSWDGTELYMVKRTSGNNDIYVSQLSDPFWTKAVPLNKNINTKSNETHASISPDGQTLYFTSDRRGGSGKLDIYTSSRIENGDWAEATNLGTTINTDQNEDTPFLTADGSRLYFSSEGHFNMGEFDIFYSDLQEDNTWAHPVNIGFPINTTGVDLFYFPIGKGDQAYYARIEKEGQGISDIYFVEIFKRSAEFTDKPAQSRFAKSFDLYILNIESSDTLIINFENSTDSFSISKPVNKYKIIRDK